MNGFHDRVLLLLPSWKRVETWGADGTGLQWYQFNRNMNKLIDTVKEKYGMAVHILRSQNCLFGCDFLEKVMIENNLTPVDESFASRWGHDRLEPDIDHPTLIRDALKKYPPKRGLDEKARGDEGTARSKWITDELIRKEHKIIFDAQLGKPVFYNLPKSLYLERLVFAISRQYKIEKAYMGGEAFQASILMNYDYAGDTIERWR